MKCRTVPASEIERKGSLRPQDHLKPKKAWFGTPPVRCDLCQKEFTDMKERAFVDGKVNGSGWAMMCMPCHRYYGCGLGGGLGQKYDLDTREKIAG